MSVYLRKQYLKKGTYLSFVESTYMPSKKNVSQKVIRKIGYLEELQNTYKDPIAYFSEEAKKLSAKSQAEYRKSKEERIPRVQTVKNLGYFPVARLYDKFNLCDEFEFLTNNTKYQMDMENLFRFLVYSQIINPGSKKSEYEKKGLFLDDFDFSDDQMYDGIKLIGEKKDYILQHLLFELKKFYTPNTNHSYFDCTNIYFEIDRENDFQRRGVEKNNRHDPIIGLGLLMDSNGIPLSYTTFPGNQSEIPELHKNGQIMKRNLGYSGRTIFVADKGLNSGDNMYNAVKNKDGYVVGQKVKGASKDLLAWILDEHDYAVTKDENGEVLFKIKSETGEYEVKTISSFNNQKSSVMLTQKRVLFYSKEYADKSIHERQKLVEKAMELIKNPSQYKKKSIGDAASYIKEIRYNNDGEIINTNLELDVSAIEKDRLLDGYYLIVTSETNLSDRQIISIYRGLWEIEESFSIVKGVLKVRPVFAKSRAGIEAHLLISFFSLMILRLIQKTILKDELNDDQKRIIEQANKRKRKHKINIKKYGELPIKRIVNFMRSYNAQFINDSYYVGTYNSDIPLFEEKYGLTLDRHRLSEKDVKKIFDDKIYNTRQN